MKYRLYKLSGKIEYKDIEADSLEEAEQTQEYRTPRDTFKVISDGLILDWTISADTENENHKVFEEKRLAQVKEELAFNQPD